MTAVEGKVVRLDQRSNKVTKQEVSKNTGRGNH